MTGVQVSNQPEGTTSRTAPEGILPPSDQSAQERLNIHERGNQTFDEKKSVLDFTTLYLSCTKKGLAHNRYINSTIFVMYESYQSEHMTEPPKTVSMVELCPKVHRASSYKGTVSGCITSRLLRTQCLAHNTQDKETAHTP